MQVLMFLTRTWLYVHFALGYLLSQIRLSSYLASNVRAPYSGVETSGNISSPLHSCT